MEDSQASLQNNQDQETSAVAIELNKMTLDSNKCTCNMRINNTDDNHTNKEPSDEEKDLQKEKLYELAKEFTENLENNERQKLEVTIEEMRRILLLKDKFPSDVLIKIGIGPNLLRVLRENKMDSQKLLYECSWILGNVASGSSENIDYLISLGAVPVGLNLLFHPDEGVKDNAIFILANMAGDSLETRDLLLESGIVDKIETLLDGNTFPLSFLQHVSWLISNLCRGSPYPPRSIISPFLPIVQSFFDTINDMASLTHVLWILSYLSDGDENVIEEVFDLCVTDEIFEALRFGIRSEDDTLIAPALRTIGNLSTSDSSDLVQILLDHGLIDLLSKLLQCKTAVLRKETCWILSNILTNEYHIGEILEFKNGEIFNKLFEAISSDEYKVAREALFCFTNVCSEGSFDDIQELVNRGLISILSGVIRTNPGDEEMVNSLNALSDILVLAKDVGEDNAFLEPILQSGISSILKDLEHNPNAEVDQKVKELKNYIEF